MANATLEFMAETLGHAKEFANLEFEIYSDFGKEQLRFPPRKATLAVLNAHYRNIINIPRAALTRLIPIIRECDVNSMMPRLLRPQNLVFIDSWKF